LGYDDEVENKVPKPKGVSRRNGGTSNAFVWNPTGNPFQPGGEAGQEA